MWRIWAFAWEWCSNSDECNWLYHGLYTVISLRCTGQLRCTLSVWHLLYGVGCSPSYTCRNPRQRARSLHLACSVSAARLVSLRGEASVRECDVWPRRRGALRLVGDASSSSPASSPCTKLSSCAEDRWLPPVSSR